MTLTAQRLFDYLYSIAREPTCPIVILTGEPGAGKKHLAKELQSLPDLGLVHVPLDFWLVAPYHDTAKEKPRNGGCNGHAQKLPHEALYHWDSFFTDIHQLKTTGHVELDDVFDPLTGLPKGPIELNVSLSPPHVILLEGDHLLHRPVVSLARAALLLEASRGTAYRGVNGIDVMRTMGTVMQSHAIRFEHSEAAYFTRHAKNGIPVPHCAERALYQLVSKRRNDMQGPTLHIY